MLWDTEEPRPDARGRRVLRKSRRDVVMALLRVSFLDQRLSLINRLNDVELWVDGRSSPVERRISSNVTQIFLIHVVPASYVY